VCFLSLLLPISRSAWMIGRIRMFYNHGMDGWKNSYLLHQGLDGRKATKDAPIDLEIGTSRHPANQTDAKP
jgi:hypothetical protein